ncbi:MAG TPA: hypothetical protein VK249_18780 [Anaerolineales bacterium]|nr:hypothetical protein [Anaerolineales bacterium]
MTTKHFAASLPGIAQPLMERGWGTYILWVPAAALIGFAIAAIFAGVLHLPRSIYLIPYVGLVSLFFYAFLRWSGLSVINLLRHNWVWGVVGAVLLGMWTVNNILSQPASPRGEGLWLVGEILWIGVVYGLIDALLLSVLPVLATWGAFSDLGWTGHWWGKILVGFIAILLSLVVTVVYHLGYPECRIAGGLVGPALGNGAMTLGYLLTNNPISAIFSHIAMHIAGVLQGPASVLQLPPHY